MSISQYLKLLREQWILVASLAALGLLVGSSLFFLRPPEYTARITMYVSSQGGVNASAAYQGAQLSQERVSSYVELLRSERVANDVIRRLSLPETAQELSSAITATTALDSVLLNLSVVDRDPVEAAKIANATAAVFTELVNELERPVDPAIPQAVAVRTVQPAAVPSIPSSTGVLGYVVAGLLGGLALGVLGAFVRNSIDTSIKSPESLQDSADAPNLTSIAYDPSIRQNPLVVKNSPQSSQSEAFRQLRTNLQFVNVDNPPKVLVVTSSLPAEGKTTTTVNLAMAIAMAGSRVLVIEADMRRPKAANLLGLDRSAGLTSILAGRARPEQVVQTWNGGAFDFLASGPLPPNPSELLASRQMKELLELFRANYDVVLIDAPPVLPVTDAAAVVPFSDGVLLVCRFKHTTRHQVQAAKRALDAVAASVRGTVLTMVPVSGVHSYARYHNYYQAAVIDNPIRSAPDDLGATRQIAPSPPPNKSSAPRPGPRSTA